MTAKSVGVRAELASTGEVGVLLPLLGDYHAHLQLIDIEELASGRGHHGQLGFVLDLGGAPLTAQFHADTLADTVTVGFAGQFLSTPGGYPSDRSWAPAGSVRFVSSADEAAAAVGEQLLGGASVIKVTLNADAGPVFDLETLEAICTVAHRSRVVVVAHAEGAGMTELALNGGVDVLAHTPFTESVKRDVLEGCIARGMAWISTFDIHGYGSPDAEQSLALGYAMDNAWRFAEAGGQMLYGTDLGNGPVPVGINSREIELLHEIGLDAEALLASMSGDWLTRQTGVKLPSSRGSFVAVDEDSTGSADDLIAALTRIRTISHEELVSYDD
jgi:hypothetical protein